MSTAAQDSDREAGRSPISPRRAGLSTATVDRALSGRRGVSAANRHRVPRAADALGNLPGDGRILLTARPAHLGF